VAFPTSTWVEAAALFLLARFRGDRFARVRQQALDETGRRMRRLTRLEAHLTSDREGWPDPQRMRRDAEALLSFPGPFDPGVSTAEVPDPYAPDQRLSIALDPSLSFPGNADRLFNKARRIERAQREAEVRLAETRAALVVERSREARLREARDLSDLAPAVATGESRPRLAGGITNRGLTRHYLTSNGLSLLVGRGMKENHHLTFRIARPEDLWLHARDVPGAHVILRDPEGRAGADDQREAAEVAAFFSDARGAAQVDVHLTRRKHVHPARGARGRVVVSHSDTLRVAPRDPEGWLRRR
jgi:predicted ribosome quality control (RQC) complex YloA/Tae2 family protein